MNQQDQNSDQLARQQALAPFASFIVQAPAGSGKTELLTQRILVLLADAVDKPEQVLAITFTQKAAAEMRERVLRSLQQAATLPEPATQPQLSNWLLSKRVLQRDVELDWQLLANPNRLRIQTIDGLCAAINHQLPIVSELGSGHIVGDQLDALYQQAALNALQTFAEQNSTALVRGLLQLDNQLQRWVYLLAQMLQNREQWLPQLLPHLYDLPALQQMLQDSLISWACQRLQALANITYSLAEFADWPDLVYFAQSQLTTPQVPTTVGQLDVLAILQAKPHSLTQKVNPAERDLWVALSILLTTQEGEWRKPRGINKTLGFPSDKDSKNPQEKALYQQMKLRLQALLTELANHPDLLTTVQQVRELPLLNYSEEEWQRITELLGMLPQAVAELKLLFQQYNQVDFSEVSLGALRALTQTQTNEIALRLDQQLRHILVDEFQDTSVSQFELLKALTVEWSEGDGRTLFLVGDPMQSIYRFRQADVGLFLLAKQQGLGNIRLTYLRLTRNFRSQPEVLNWINQHFQRMFPAADDGWSGAVSYASSTAGRVADPAVSAGVEVQLFADETTHTQRMVSAIAACYQQHPAASIAVLVRQRRHAQGLLQGLTHADIPVQAIDMQSLVRQPLLQDMLALTQTLLFPEQPLAWAAVLRAPWCGVLLTDLLQLRQQLPSLSALAQPLNWQDIHLSADAKLRVQCLQHHWQAVQQLRHLSISQRVLRLWQALQAELCYPIQQRIDTRQFLDLLDRLQQTTPMFSAADLLTRVQQLYAPSPAVAGRAVQVMTIHKAKGLEFDWVFIPHLEKSARVEEAELLIWSATHRPNQSDGLLLASLPATRQTIQPASLYACLRTQQRQKAEYESLRLFYVAATRARVGLQLFAILGAGKEENTPDEITELQSMAVPSLRKPVTGSFLRALTQITETWEVYLQSLQQPTALPHSEAASLVSAKARHFSSILARVPLAGLPVAAEPAHPVVPIESASISQAQHHKQWSFILSRSQITAAMGTVAHTCIAASSTGWLLGVSGKTFFYQLRGRLHSLGLREPDLTMAAKFLQQAFICMSQDTQAVWLQTAHPETQHEYPILTAEGWQRIDHTFVCDNVRWIVDYKLLTQNFMSSPQLIEQVDLNRYADESVLQGYQQQLYRYARAFRHEARPINLALYWIGAVNGWQVIQQVDT